MVPLETHLSFFKKFNLRLQGGEIVSIQEMDDKTLVKIKTETEEFNMILSLVSGKNNEVKFEGIMLD